MNLDFVPVPFYCEENVLRLCRSPGFPPPDAEAQSGGGAERCEAFAVFVSNARRSVALLEQKASNRPDGLVVWDYHVFAVSSGSGRALAWDFDTRLPLPCPLSAYLDAVFPTGAGEAFLPRFRLVPAADYTALLASDRSHMRDASGRFLAPPPPWPCPGAGRPNNLMRFVDMDDGFAGKLMGLEGMRELFQIGL